MSFVILTPSLGCPSLLQKGTPVDMLLLADSRKIGDELQNLVYTSWQGKREKGFDAGDFEILPFEPLWYHVSRFILSAYRKKGLQHIMRIRIATSMKKGLYQLHNPHSPDISEIIKTMKSPSYAPAPSIEDACTHCWKYGSDPVRLHHPFYVGEKDYLNIAHLSDSHLAARMWMLEKRWNSNYNRVWEASSLSGKKPGEFSNYIEHFQHILSSINQNDDVDMIIHTGDITDYNRGYDNEEGDNDFSRDYYFNRNWLLFYEILLGEYQKPLFTVLGNHDYRLNPYAPHPLLFSRRIREFFNMAPTVNLTRQEMNTLHEDPHALHVLENHLITAPQAVQWYSLVINPLFDYQISYGSMMFMFMDWRRWEDHERRTPWARRVISRSQWNMLTDWHRRMVKRRKRMDRPLISVVALHPSVFNPFPEMGDREFDSTAQTGIFYDSRLIDTYDEEKDLVDGTFRLRRSEFIRLCLGNSTYGIDNDFHIAPERGIDLILTGHAHRQALFQVEGAHVNLIKSPSDISPGPLFCNAISSGPIGMKNERGGPAHIQLAPPGYYIIFCKPPIQISPEVSSIGCIREETRLSFGERMQGSGFEILSRGGAGRNSGRTYSWVITNRRENSSLTRITMYTGYDEEIEIKKMPLGWRFHMRSGEKGWILICEAHDRGQGILYSDEGEMEIKASGLSLEKMGQLTVSWDMQSEESSPVRVYVPGT
jgi:predicted phosphodiesterase